MVSATFHLFTLDEKSHWIGCWMGSRISVDSSGKEEVMPFI
jgi:hypothetical protein